MDDKQKKTLGMGLGALAIGGLVFGIYKATKGTGNPPIVAPDEPIDQPIVTPVTPPILTDWLSNMPPVPTITADNWPGWYAGAIVRDLGSGWYGPDSGGVWYDDDGNPVNSVNLGDNLNLDQAYWAYLYMTSLYVSKEDMIASGQYHEYVPENPPGQQWVLITIATEDIVSVYEANTPYNNIADYSGWSYPTHWHVKGWIPKFASPEGKDTDFEWVTAQIPEWATSDNKRWQRKRYPFFVPCGQTKAWFV